jgi:hypothetical protein
MTRDQVFALYERCLALADHGSLEQREKVLEIAARVLELLNDVSGVEMRNAASINQTLH